MPINFTAKSDGIVPAGQLRRKLTIQQQVNTPDGAGGYTPTWTTYATVFGAMQPWKPYQQLLGQQAVETVWVRYLIRWQPSLNIVTGMRLVDYNTAGSPGTTYTIVSAFDPDGTQRQLHITCQQVAPGT